MGKGEGEGEGGYIVRGTEGSMMLIGLEGKLERVKRMDYTTV